MTADVLNLGSVNWVSAIDTLGLWMMVLVMTIAFGLIFYFMWDWIRWNIYVEIVRQVGEPFVEVIKDEKDNIINQTWHINYESEPKVARLYEKKMKSGGSKEYLKIKGTNWDYQNFFTPQAFYSRKVTWFGDFKKKGIKLMRDPEKGLVPLVMGDPGFKLQGTSLNEVIGAISDSLYEREQLYGDDFWSRYGQIITISFLTAFLVIGMMFIIKYQDVFWQNSMNALQITLNSVKETATPGLT